VFEKLAKKKYGNKHYRRRKLLRLAIEAILGSREKVVFATQGSGNLSTFKTLESPVITKPTAAFCRQIPKF